MDVFPHILLRIGGDSYDNLRTLNVSFNSDLEKIQADMNSLKDEISALLYADIANFDDPKKQNLLLNLKRDVFNERHIEDLLTGSAIQHTGEETKTKIKDFVSSAGKMRNEIEKIKSCYEKELPALRETLKELSRTNNIQNGLILSSHSLYKNIKEYIVNHEEYTKSSKKTEISVIKYLSRTYAKTTPFSSFNSLAYGRLENLPSGEFFYFRNSGDLKKKSCVKLNNNLFAFIRNCIFSLKELYGFLYIKANPTITGDDSSYKYLINLSNYESIQILKRNPIIEYLLSILTEKGRIVFNEFADKLLSDEILDASKEEIEAYLYKLTEIGFFEFDIGISGYDSLWSLKLADYLRSIKVDTVTKTIILSTLDSLNLMRPEFESAGLKSRIEISRRAFELFSKLKSHLDGILKPADSDEKETKDDSADDKPNPNIPENTGADNNRNKSGGNVINSIRYIDYGIRTESLFFEDTIIENEFLLNKDIVTNILRNAQKFYSYFNDFEGRDTERITMYNFFSERYKSDTRVDLLAFYEEYTKYKKERKKKKEDDEKKKKENTDDKINETPNKDLNAAGITKEPEGTENPDEHINKRYELQKKYLDNIAALVKEKNKFDAGVLELDDTLLTEAMRLSGIKPKKLNSSIGFFLQFLSISSNAGGTEIKAVINASFPGYGKMTSRFLDLFPDVFLNETRLWNEKYSDNCLIAENIDSGIMNFNLHPPLMPYEISIPGGNYSLDIQKRLPVSGILIEKRESEKQLALIDKETNKRIYVFDLGFMGFAGRSELFLFLENFTLSRLLFSYPLVKRLHEFSTEREISFDGKKGKVFNQPRITFNETIILSRKAWIIPSGLIPRKHENEKESEYFAKIQEWRSLLKIPDEVFIYIKNENEEGNSSKAKKKFSRDDYKPQYICFSNPFLARLFEKQVDKVTKELRIEEMLPSTEQLLSINGKRYVTEFVVQNYNFETNEK